MSEVVIPFLYMMSVLTAFAGTLKTIHAIVKGWTLDSAYPLFALSLVFCVFAAILDMAYIVVNKS